MLKMTIDEFRDFLCKNITVFHTSPTLVCGKGLLVERYDSDYDVCDVVFPICYRSQVVVAMLSIKTTLQQKADLLNSFVHHEIDDDFNPIKLMEFTC
jgi:hypothetical protein